MILWLEQNAETHAMRVLKALPEQRRATAFARVISAFERAANINPDVTQCEEGSLVEALLYCAAIDLYPGGLQPGVYLIPRKNKGVLELTVQVSYHGLLQVARLSGNRNIRVRPVFEGEHFECSDGLEGESLTHTRRMDVERTWDALQGCYIVGTRPDGTVGCDFLGKSEIIARRDASTSKTGPWKSWPVEMSLKTVIRYSISRGTFPLEDRFVLALADTDATTEEVRALGRNVITAEPPMIEERPPEYDWSKEDLREAAPEAVKANSRPADLGGMP